MFAALASDVSGAVTIVVVGVLVSALAFLIGREVVTWYWKINAALELLTSIDRRLWQLTEQGKEAAEDRLAGERATAPKASIPAQ
jgi:hypothetical protein